MATCEAERCVCDAIPVSCHVELSLIDVFVGTSTQYRGTVTLGYQVEHTANCLFFHVDDKRVILGDMRVVQGKRVSKPRGLHSCAAGSGSCGNLTLAWSQPGASINVSSFLPPLPIGDLKLVELAHPASYCVLELVVEFRGSLTDDHTGIYVAASRPAGAISATPSIRSAASAGQRLIATQFEVDHARRCFPCVDFVFIRQAVSFSLTVPHGAYCRANGGAAEPSASARDTAAAPAAVRLDLPPSARRIPMYVAGFVASTIPLVCNSRSLVCPRIAVSTHSDDEELDEMALVLAVVSCHDSPFNHKLALDAMHDAVRELRGFLHCNIDVPELALVAIPELLLGGMENDGIIFIREALGTPAGVRKPAAAATHDLVRLIVHEVAHHWIGNRIGFGFAWKEGITLVIERYFGNLLLGLPLEQGSTKGSCENDERAALVQVEHGSELSGETYHRVEAAMEGLVRRLGWSVFQRGLRRMCQLPTGTFVPDEELMQCFK